MLLFKNLLVTAQDLVLAITRHLLEGNLILAIVLPDTNQRPDDFDGLLVEAFHHRQLVKKHEIAIIAAVFLQLLILERIDEMQLHELYHIVAVEVDGVVAEEDVIVQQLLVVDVVVAVLRHTLHLLDEQLV